MIVKAAGPFPNGTPFSCDLAECVRTTIYQGPRFFAADGEGASSIVVRDDGFQAAITTDPVQFLADSDITGQFAGDSNFAEAIRKQFVLEPPSPGIDLHIVFQQTQGLGGWPADEGQCIQDQTDGVERLYFFDGGEFAVPDVDNHAVLRNAVLAAVRIDMDLTARLSTVVDQTSFRSTDNRWLWFLRVRVGSAEGSSLAPLTPEELRLKGSAVASTSARIRERLEAKGSVSPTLEAVLEVLEMEFHPNDQSRRLWYLLLHDRTRRLLATLDQKIKKEPGFENVNKHRNEIAHEGVDRLDVGMARELIEKACGAISRHLAESERVTHSAQQGGSADQSPA